MIGQLYRTWRRLESGWERLVVCKRCREHQSVVEWCVSAIIAVDVGVDCRECVWIVEIVVVL